MLTCDHQARSPRHCACSPEPNPSLRAPHIPELRIPTYMQSTAYLQGHFSRGPKPNRGNQGFTEWKQFKTGLKPYNEWDVELITGLSVAPVRPWPFLVRGRNL